MGKLTSEALKVEIIKLLFIWQLSIKHIPKYKQVYESLKSSKIITEDPQVKETEIPVFPGECGSFLSSPLPCSSSSRLISLSALIIIAIWLQLHQPVILFLTMKNNPSSSKLFFLVIAPKTCRPPITLLKVLSRRFVNTRECQSCRFVFRRNTKWPRYTNVVRTLIMLVICANWSSSWSLTRLLTQLD